MNEDKHGFLNPCAYVTLKQPNCDHEFIITGEKDAAIRIQCKNCGELIEGDKSLVSQTMQYYRGKAQEKLNVIDAIIEKCK